MKFPAIIVAGAVLAACQPTVDDNRLASATVTPVDGDPVRGLDVADRNCSLCHAIGRSGTSPHPKAPELRTISRRYPVDALSEALAEGIVIGHTGMPQIQLEPDKIRDLVAYLESIQMTTATPR